MTYEKITMTNKERVLSISKELGLTHIGSNISALPVLEEIYEVKQPEDIVILDNAHAHLAHLVVRVAARELSSITESEIEFIKSFINTYGIHCDRQDGCDASGGSLGHGIGIGIGYALVDKKRDVYVVVSDGSMMEGSNWEALRIASSLKLKNLHIHCNFNGYTALAKSNPSKLFRQMTQFYDDITLHLTSNTSEYEGVKGHYIKAL